MDTSFEPIGRKSSTSTKAIGAFLFLGGLVLMIGTYFTAAPIAIPMMIVGVAYPFAYSYMRNHGADWDDARDGNDVVMSRREGQRILRDQAADRYEIESHRYEKRSTV